MRVAFAALIAMTLLPTPAAPQVVDLSTIRCKDFLDSSKETIAPPQEIANQRISFYVGWKQLDGLNNLSRTSRLSFSGIFRRLLHALLVTHKINFVQKEPGKPFYLEIKKADEAISPLSGQHRGKT